MLPGLEGPLETRELEGLAFECLPGCGWCCTHPAEVSDAELTAIRGARPNVKIGTDGNRLYLRLRGGCGACQFLTDDRRCGVYEQRPAHCRFFPFHVYFGRRVEVVLNRSCPGVAQSPGSSLRAAAKQALSKADPAVVARHVQESSVAHATFRQNCESNGVWGDVDRVVSDALARGADLFTGRVLEELSDEAPAHILEHTLGAFEGADASARPYYADPAFQWWVFQRRAQRVAAAELAADGGTQIRQVMKIERWTDAPLALRNELLPHARELLSRESFAGSVFDLVDEEDYELPLEDAARASIAEVLADLLVRAHLIVELRSAAKGRPLSAAAAGGTQVGSLASPHASDLNSNPALWASEARRFYDSDFLDRPTIGAWL
ncbi:MAG: YkgJ family cysteine cluster protein [Thermoplasmatota archaeon]